MPSSDEKENGEMKTALVETWIKTSVLYIVSFEVFTSILAMPVVVVVVVVVVAVVVGVVVVVVVL